MADIIYYSLVTIVCIVCFFIMCAFLFSSPNVESEWEEGYEYMSAHLESGHYRPSDVDTAGIFGRPPSPFLRGCYAALNDYCKNNPDKDDR